MQPYCIARNNLFVNAIDFSIINDTNSIIICTITTWREGMPPQKITNTLNKGEEASFSLDANFPNVAIIRKRDNTVHACLLKRDGIYHASNILAGNCQPQPLTPRKR